MLQEQELKTFVEGTTSFFAVAAQQPASIGSPYLLEGTPAVHEYTGIINISGKREGVVMFTAPKAISGLAGIDVGRYGVAWLFISTSGP